MKKLFALILAICLSVTVLADLAEEDDFGYYPDEYPESQVFMSTWVAEDGDAVFTINENGCLVWTDLKEDAGKGLEFEKIGDFYGSRWVKDDIDILFYDWYEGEYDIRCYKYGENDEILADAIFKGAYDPATDTVTADGFFDPDEPLTVTFSYQKDEEAASAAGFFFGVPVTYYLWRAQAMPRTAP